MGGDLETPPTLQKAVWGFYTSKNKTIGSSDGLNSEPTRLDRAPDWVWGLSATFSPFQESARMGGSRLTLFPKITCIPGLFLS